jgi:hypothetical protein
MSLFLLGTFYATIVLAGLGVELAFDAVGLIPTGPRHAKVIEASVTWNCTTFLNNAFLTLTFVLLVRFVRTGGLRMLRMMNEPTGEGGRHEHGGHGGHRGHGGHDPALVATDCNCNTMLEWPPRWPRSLPIPCSPP